MINLHTGMPRNGKSLFTLAYVIAYALKENRDVYYNGIKGLKVPGWIEFEDGLKCHDLPTGAIIVMDECQQHFRPRAYGTNTPKHIADFETHGHRGHDFFLITQNPKLIDVNIRSLTQYHRHVVRKWGTQNATIHLWEGEVRMGCEEKSKRKDSQKTHWAYPKKLFEMYHSSDQHTVKRTIPRAVYVLAIAPFVIGALVFTIYTNFQKMGHKNSTSKSDGISTVDQPATPRQLTYIQAHTAEIQGLPFTAPAYREVMKPSIAPKPVACITSSKGCGCYTQQGTKIADMPDLTCKSIVENGFFDDAPDKQQDKDYFDKQNRNAALVQAPQEPSRVGAGGGGSVAVLNQPTSVPVPSDSPYDDPAAQRTGSKPSKPKA